MTGVADAYLDGAPLVAITGQVGTAPMLLAEAMHCKGYRVEKAADLIPTLEEAFRQTVPSVIVVPVDYSENMKLSAHLKEVYQQSSD